MTDASDRLEREHRQQQLNLAQAYQQTLELRESEEPRWQRLRERLASEGVSPEDAAVARKNTEDVRMEFGIVITRDGRAFSFDFDFLRDEEGNELRYEDALVKDWVELEESKRGIYESDLNVGREVLEA